MQRFSKFPRFTAWCSDSISYVRVGCPILCKEPLFGGICATIVDELIHHELRRLECVVLNVAPRFVADRRVRLPIKRANVSQLAALQIEHTGMLLHRAVFVENQPFGLSVVILRVQPPDWEPFRRTLRPAS